MKIESLTRPGLIALGVAGIGAIALLGFAAGMAVSRDPEAVRRSARRVAGAAALGLERARLMAAQAREHAGDLWAEAREAAVVDTDEADFKRAEAGASKAAHFAAEAAATAEVDSVPTDKPARKRAIRARKTRVVKSRTVNTSGDGATGGG